MSISRRFASAGVVLLCLLVQANWAFAATFTTGVTTGGNWQTLYVQGFSPSIAPTPDPGAAAGDTVTLSQIQFFKSGTADTAANIQLAIFNTMYPNLSGLSTSTSGFIGLSTNTIVSTAPLATGDAETFTFNNLPLTYGNNYGAIFVNVGVDAGSGAPLTPVRVSALAENYIESPAGSGNFIPDPNYGGLDNFSFATSNFINGDFFSAFSRGGDALFTATLTAVPEPVFSGLAVVGGMLLGSRWRRTKVQ
jgi:hypothetical protein